MFKNLPEKIFTPATMLEKKFLKFLLSNMDNENIKDELKLFSIIFLPTLKNKNCFRASYWISGN